MCSWREPSDVPSRVAGGWSEAAVTDLSRPAWSDAFATGAHLGLRRDRPFGTMDRQAAFGDSGGRGVTVAIIDSGVEADHPAIGGRLIRSLRVESAGDRHRVVDDPEPGDLVGHGTACAGIIHAIAPAAALVSIRVLGPDNRGAGPAFASALEWAIGERFGIMNSACLHAVMLWPSGSTSSPTRPTSPTRS